MEAASSTGLGGLTWPPVPGPLWTLVSQALRVGLRRRKGGAARPWAARGPFLGFPSLKAGARQLQESLLRPLGSGSTRGCEAWAPCL